MIKDKVAVITGAAQGIGRAITEKFLANGAKVVVADVMEDKVQELVKELSGRGQVMGVKVDVSSTISVEEMVKKVLDNFSVIDILINNAGVTRDNLLIRMKEEEWDLVLNVNLKGAFNCTKAVAKHMMKQRRGRIVNIASIVGIIGNAGQANYAASKGGLIALTKTCAKELASRNINVNAVAPGFISTKMTDVLPQQVKDTMMKLIPLSKFGSADDVADLCLFLSSEMSSYITGQVIKVDGGMVT